MVENTEKSAFLESSNDTTKDAENPTEKTSKGGSKKCVIIGGIVALAIIAVALLVGFFVFHRELKAEMENPGSSNLLKGKMPGDVIQIDTDEETINTTIEPDEIDSTDSAQNLDEIDNQSENDLEEIDDTENAQDESNTDAPVIIEVTTSTTTTTTTTTTIDLCSPNPCQNNGICNKDSEKFTCDCAGTGFSGETCEINVDDCLPDSCNNHGVCSDLVNGFSCECDTGYDGDHCENDINECAENPCQNSGICNDEIGKYSCNCSGTGHDGINCEKDIDECLSDPCQNDGKCVNEIGKFKCECQDGWDGDLCESDIDDCLPSNPCQNNGKCSDSGTNSFQCECAKFWEGPTCVTAQTKFALKEVQMKVNPHTGGGGCGGAGTTAKIMIYDKVSVCHTKAILYPTGKTVVWKSDDQLKNCVENKFTPKESKIYYRIKPTDNDKDYCVDEVAVILDDQKSTKYMTETDDKWRDGVSDTFELTKP